MEELEWKNQSKSMINDMITHEMGIKEAIKNDIPELQFPNASVTFNSKIDELYETFGHDGTPLNQHVIVVVESHYILGELFRYIRDLDDFFFSILGARERKDDEELRKVLGTMEERQKLWADIDEGVLNFDFQTDLDKAFEGNVPIPPGVTKEKAKAICKAELEQVKYVPKKYPNIYEEPPTGMKM